MFVESSGMHRIRPWARAMPAESSTASSAGLPTPPNTPASGPFQGFRDRFHHHEGEIHVEELQADGAADVAAAADDVVPDQGVDLFLHSYSPEYAGEFPLDDELGQVRGGNGH